MAAASLDFSIQKNLVNEKLRDMSQLAEKVRWIEQIKFKKEQGHKVAYIEISNFTSDSYFNQDIDIEYEGEVNIVELKLGSHYVCQMLKPEDNRNNFLNAKYNFDVSKAYKEELVQILMFDVVPEDVLSVWVLAMDVVLEIDELKSVESNDSLDRQY
ncbi:hypothetical protein GmHk_09G024951 [Glycine max]|nr:hypothetical protein GmHk_09G024951 [Glycine max]